MKIVVFVIQFDSWCSLSKMSSTSIDDGAVENFVYVAGGVAGLLLCYFVYRKSTKLPPNALTHGYTN